MYRVEWLQSALNDLAAIWVQAGASLRHFITIASHQIDVRLQQDPLAESQVLAGDIHIRFVIPLAATYRIEADGVTVSVLHVWLVLPQNGRVMP
jgi:hypothetical protein